MKKKSPYREPGEPHIDPLPVRLRVRDSIRSRLKRVGDGIKGVFKAYDFSNGYHALATIFGVVLPAICGFVFLLDYVVTSAHRTANRSHRKGGRINLPYQGTIVITTRSAAELTEALSREGIDATKCQTWLPQ